MQQITVNLYGKFSKQCYATDYEGYLAGAKMKFGRIGIKTIVRKDRHPGKPIEVAEILPHLSGTSHTNSFFLAEWGKSYTTSEFCSILETYYNDGEDVNFVVGNALGWSHEVREYANTRFLSLSKMTFSHEFAAVLLAEQIFRFADWKAGGKYTK